MMFVVCFTEMDRDQISLNILPDEILVSIFRMFPASEFVTSLPFVCKRWMELITADTYTLKRVGMHHSNSIKTVKFFYLENEYCDHNLLTSQRNFFQRLLSHEGDLTVSVEYSKAFYLCTVYSEIFEYIKILVISAHVSIYETQGFTHLDPCGLTTLVLYDTKINLKDQSILSELGDVYPNIENVLYVMCGLSNQVEFKFLHCGFKNLKRFRFDHYTVNHRYLIDLLKTHHDIKTIYFDACMPMGDRWIDALTHELKGRSIQSLSMCSPYFTEIVLNQFLESDLILDRSKVYINNIENPIPFYMNIV